MFCTPKLVNHSIVLELIIQTSKLSVATKYKVFFIGKTRKRRKIDKYTGKCVNAFEFLDINLVVLSVTSGNVTTTSVISAIGALFGLTTLFMFIFLTLSNII